MRIWPLLVCVSAFAAVAARAGAAPPVQRLLVLDTQIVNVDELSPAIITEKLALAVGAVSAHSLSTMDDVRAALSAEEARQFLACDAASCFAEIMASAQADLVLRSSMGRLGTSMIFGLSLMDVKLATSVAQTSVTGDGLTEVDAMVAEAVGNVFSADGQSKVRFTLPEGKSLSFAILDLQASGVTKEVAKNLTQILSVEVKRINNSSVVSRDDINAMLQVESDKMLLGCGDSSCLAEIGGALGVDKLIVGDVGMLADRYVISLRLIDGRRVSVDNRVSESFRGGEEQLIRAVRFAARSLVGIAPQESGALVVSADQPDVEVFINQEAAGELPMPAVAGLSPGKHSVRLSKPGFLEWQSDVYVDPAETSSLWAELQPGPERWYQRWWVWAIAGAVVVGSTSAVLLAVTQNPPPGSGVATIQP